MDITAKRKIFYDLTFEGNLATVADNGTITLYTENPTNGFTQANPWKEAPTETVELGRIVETENNRNEIFHGFRIDSNIFYVRGEGNNGLGGLEKTNYLDFPQYFEVLNNNKAPDNILANYLDVNNRIDGEGQDFSWLMNVKASNKTEDIARRKKIRSIVCQHPLEWNKDLYDNDELIKKLEKRFYLDEECLGHFRAKMAKQDLWSNANGERVGISEMPRENIWFAHPVYFINHLNKARLLDRSFNPYYDGGVTTTNVPFRCVDNPGFAPVWTDRKDEENDRFRNLFKSRMVNRMPESQWDLSIL